MAATLRARFVSANFGCWVGGYTCYPSIVIDTLESQRSLPATGTGFTGPCKVGNGKSNKDRDGTSPKATDQR